MTNLSLPSKLGRVTVDCERLRIPVFPPSARSPDSATWCHPIAFAGPARTLLARAQAAGRARSEIDARDLLALATGIALAGLPDDRTERLFALARHGYAT